MEFKVGEASCNILPFINDGLSEEAQSKIRLLTHLFVPEEHRRQGHATELMKQVEKDADEAQLALIVQPGEYDDGELTGKDLEKFYESHKFIKIQDKPLIMVRYATPLNLEPKKTARAIQDIYGNPLH